VDRLRHPITADCAHADPNPPPPPHNVYCDAPQFPNVIVFYHLLSGAVAGLLSGLFGVGGGIVLVPALLLLLQSQPIPASAITHFALGTSLASIVATSLASGWTHHRQGNIDWPLATLMAPFAALGTQVGAALADAIDGQTLRQLFGLFEIGVGIKMWRRSEHRATSLASLSPRWVYPTGGLAIGAASALFGIGGGTLTVPISHLLLGRPIPVAIGTAAVVGVVVALCGTVGFVYHGLGQADFPPEAAGYVLVPSALMIAVASVPAAFYGARLAHRAPVLILRHLFSILLFVVGVRLLMP